MALFCTPNVERADALVTEALERRRAMGAGPIIEEPSAIWLGELVPDDGGSYSPYTDARHFGQVARMMMRLVYELSAHDPNGRPADLGPKHSWVVDVHMPVTEHTRTGYLAVSVDHRRAVLMPLPELPPVLLDRRGSIDDTRQAMREVATAICDLINLALPAARTMAAQDVGRST